MEGTQPDTPPAPPPMPALRSRRKQILLVLALAAVIVVASFSAYVLTRPPPLVPVTIGGWTTGVIAGDFANVTAASALAQYFNATMYVYQSGGPTSALTLRLSTSTYYDPSFGGGLVLVNINATVQGKFASDLHLSGLTLTCNQTGPSWDRQYIWGIAKPGPTNTSYDPVSPQEVGVATEPGNFTPGLLNQTGDGPFYDFVFPAYLIAQDPLGWNAFFGFRATVTGTSMPAVSVGILLEVVDAPGGSWGWWG